MPFECELPESRTGMTGPITTIRRADIPEQGLQFEDSPRPAGVSALQPGV